MFTPSLALVMLTQFGTIDGQIRDARTHLAIPLARVELLRAQTPIDLKITDSDGRFTFRYVAPGPYTIAVNHYDYRVSSVEIDAPAVAFPVFVDLVRKEAPSAKASVKSLREYLVPKEAKKEFDQARGR